MANLDDYCVECRKAKDILSKPSCQPMPSTEKIIMTPSISLHPATQTIYNLNRQSQSRKSGGG